MTDIQHIDIEKDIKNTNAIRAIACIGIMLTHLPNIIEEDCLWIRFSDIGYLCVGIFFFYSGYNLLYKYNKKGLGVSFIYNTLMRIVIPFMLGNAIYWWVMILLGREQFDGNWLRLIGIPITNKVLWYLVSLLSLYGIFFLLSFALKTVEHKILGKQSNMAQIGVALITYLVYVAIYPWIAYKVGCIYDMNSKYPISFLIGMIWCVIKNSNRFDNTKAFVTRYKIEIFILMSAICMVIHRYFVNGAIWGSEKTNWAEMLPPVLCVIAVNVLIINENIDSKILMIVGKVSLWIYIWHMVTMFLWRNDYVYIQNVDLFVLVYVITTVLLSILSSKISEIVRTNTDNIINKVSDKFVKQ